MNANACLVLSLIALACEARPRLTLNFVGDVLLAEQPGETLKRGGDPFAHVARHLAEADLSVGNLECAVASVGTAVPKMYTFRADPRVLPTLRRHLHAVSLANNHSGDFGPAALQETMSGLRAAGVPFFGAGENLSQAHRALLLEANGLRVGLLGYDEFFPRWFEADTETAGAAWSEDEQVVLDIATARRRGADVVIPFMHWGWENETEPSVRQRTLARRMIDAGADAVVGAHPHVTQGVDYYRGKPIIYSLGNFVFDLLDNDNQRLGWILRLELDQLGIARWSTAVVRIDDQGTPWLLPDAESPCGARGFSSVGSCRGAR